MIQKLGIAPIELVRQKEAIWINQFKGKILSDLEIIEAIANHPILMERPIVFNDKKAVIGRPSENIKKIV